VEVFVAGVVCSRLTGVLVAAVATHRAIAHGHVGVVGADETLEYALGVGYFAGALHWLLEL